MASAIGLALLGTGLVAATADAASGSFPRAYNPETAPGFTNTFTPPVGSLMPACPQAIMGTPGSDPATKVLNDALNTPASFQPGGAVHYTYDDNAHQNSGTANFTIQDCVVAYPAGTFQPGDFNGDGVLVAGAATSAMLKSGTQLDGGELSGISDATGAIHFSWTVPASLTEGTWVCNFARDIKNNHGGGGNRKVLPACFQVTVQPPPPPPLLDVAPQIYVGYADNLHMNDGTKVFYAPQPWAGSPDVVFLGCDGPTQCGGDGKFDGGAIRIDNVDNDANLVVTNASVDIGPCHYQPWDALLPATATPGMKLVLTQTGSLGPPMPAPCRDAIDPIYWAQTNFDTSERAGDSRVLNIYNCDTATAVNPVIHLTLSDGTELTITDTQKVLNTGGSDSHACTGKDEASSWVVVPY